MFTATWPRGVNGSIPLWYSGSLGSSPSGAFMNGNEQKDHQLGISYGTACNRLRKQIMFDLVKRCGLDDCYKCRKKIKTIEEFSIEHKTSWLHSDNPVNLFFDLDNISFSHLKCNKSSSRRARKHPSLGAYSRGCRCDDCRKLKSTQHKQRKQKMVMVAD